MKRSSQLPPGLIVQVSLHYLGIDASVARPSTAVPRVWVCPVNAVVAHKSLLRRQFQCGFWMPIVRKRSARAYLCVATQPLHVDRGAAHHLGWTTQILVFLSAQPSKGVRNKYPTPPLVGCDIWARSVQRATKPKQHRAFLHLSGYSLFWRRFPVQLPLVAAGNNSVCSQTASKSARDNSQRVS